MDDRENGKVRELFIQELFVEELPTIRGGTRPLLPCPWVTTMACGEEQFPCSLCQ